MINCVICDKKLSGRQKKFCSINCQGRYFGSYAGPYAKNRDAQAIPRKRELIKMAGGCCIKCGYNKNMSALCFHHVDKSLKKFDLDLRAIGNRSVKNGIAEMRKCVLVCMNCHSEIHHPDLNLEP